MTTFCVQLKQIKTKLMQRENSGSLVWLPIATSLQMNYQREKFNKPDGTNCIATSKTIQLRPVPEQDNSTLIKFSKKRWKQIMNSIKVFNGLFYYSTLTHTLKFYSRTFHTCLIRTHTPTLPHQLGSCSQTHHRQA